MKRLGLLTVGFIFLFVGIGFAAPDFAKLGALKTEDQFRKKAGSIGSTAATANVRSTVRTSLEAKTATLKSGGTLANYKVNVATQTKLSAGKSVQLRGAPVTKGNGFLQKATPVVALPKNNAPAAKLKAPVAQKSAGSLAMPKIGGGTKIGGIGQIGFGK